ncbi:MAG: hypothetical protein IJH37_05090 [Clostridia bacterium]|nr:hypothetical protein [Clostridia bacterium]
MLEKAIKAIREQQEASKFYNVKYCASELMAILKHNPDKAELVLQDLENPDMSISKCEKKIGELFHKNGGSLSLHEPIKVISDFYGLNIDPEKTAELMYGNGVGEAPIGAAQMPAPGRINIDDFI